MALEGVNAIMEATGEGKVTRRRFLEAVGEVTEGGIDGWRERPAKELWDDLWEYHEGMLGSRMDLEAKEVMKIMVDIKRASVLAEVPDDQVGRANMENLRSHGVVGGDTLVMQARGTLSIH